MPRITHRLTAIKVASLKAKGLHADGNGLYLRVTAGGTKSWIFGFTRDGTVHDMGLGPLATISLVKARELAVEARRQRLEDLHTDPFLSSVPGPSWPAIPGTPRAAALVDDMRASAPGIVLAYG